MPPVPPPVALRRMRPADVAAVRRLERRCFGGNVGPPALLRAFLADPSAAGLVVETFDGVLAGYLLLHFAAADREVRLCQFVVCPSFRRRGIGTHLLRWVTKRTPPDSGIRVRTGVHEANLTAQLFLRANDFQAVRVLPRAACGGGDLYLFAF